MRSLAFLALSSSLVACATTAPSGSADVPESVRERLETKDARMWIAPVDLAGAITAERRASGSWSGSTVDLGIANGELILSADQHDISVEALQLTFKPLQLPQGLFGAQTAELTNVRLDLTKAARTPAQWTDNNTATFTAMLDVEIHWSLELDGSPAPLGSPKLPPVPVEIRLGGDGAEVTAELGLHASGELWSWAGLVKLRELQLSVDASL